MGTVKAYILGADEEALDAAGRSKQVPDDAWDYGKTGAQEPPYNLEALAQFLETNTSHYRCVPSGSLVMMEGGNEKPIESVREGDKVLASDGHPHVVLRTMSRPFAGLLVELTAAGSSLPLLVTPEHPVNSVLGDELACPRRGGVSCKPGKNAYDRKCGTCIAPRTAVGAFRKADQLSSGDWLSSPIRPRGDGAGINVQGVALSADTARLLGWYLAEGSVTVVRKRKSQRDVRVSFCFGSDEQEIVGELRSCLERAFGLGGCIQVDQRRHTIQVIVMSPRLGGFLALLGGVGCQAKRIHPDLMTKLTRPLALEVLKAYFEGDGSRRPDTSTGEKTAVFTTTSPVLARQTRALLEDLGYIPLYRESMAFNAKLRTRHDTYLTAEDVNCFLAGRPGVYGTRRKDAFEHGGMLWRKIRSMVRVPYRGLVHNLEVADDPTFVANGFLVHNCVKAKAISTAGLGYDFVVPDGIKDPDPANKATLQEFFSCPNEEMTWGELLENVLTDFEALGNGYFEVVRNRFGAGPPRAIYHVPAVTMRVRKDRRGFIQRRGLKSVYFRNFGTDPASPDAFDPRDRDKPPSRRRLCHEVIHLKNYHPRSSYYGLPDFLPALRALVGNKMAGDFNIQFFENNAVPQYAIIVKGGELAKGTRQRIEEYFREHIKGQAHKTLILEIPTDEGQTIEVEIKPLSVDIKDSSFRMFRSDNAEEIRVAHGVPGRLIGLTEKGGLGGAGEGTSQQEIFKYHVIEPKQTRLEYRINNFLIKRGFGIHDWEIRFREIDVTDEAKVAEIVQRLVHLGVLTINEGRHEMGYKPFDHKGADIPFIMASAGPMCLDMLVEGGVRPMNMSPPEPDTEQGRRLIESLMSIRKVLHGEVARRRAG